MPAKAKKILNSLASVNISKNQMDTMNLTLQTSEFEREKK